VIDGGKIVESGTHQALLDKRGFYHQLYTSQFKGQAI
jgi:ATP-binding cassette subfamily B protein